MDKNTILSCELKNRYMKDRKKALKHKKRLNDKYPNMNFKLYRYTHNDSLREYFYLL